MDGDEGVVLVAAGSHLVSPSNLEQQRSLYCAQIGALTSMNLHDPWVCGQSLIFGIYV